jgi:chromosome segregation ATPase
MTDHDLEQIRAILRDELAPIEGRLGAVEGQIAPIDGRLSALEAKTDAVKADIDSWPDLSFLQTAAQRLGSDMLGLRDDMRVLSAIAMRLDNSHSILLEELRATHAQIARMNDRVRRLEDQQAPPL